MNAEICEIGSRAQSEFGRRLAEARQRKGVKQLTLAGRLGLSRTSISNVERGDQRVSLDFVYQAAHVLGVSLEELLPALEEVVTPVVGVRTASDASIGSKVAEEALRAVLERQTRRGKSNSVSKSDRKGA